MARTERFRDAMFLKQHIDEARRFVERVEGLEFEQTVNKMVFHYDPERVDQGVRLESPLEAAFWIWWHAMLTTPAKSNPCGRWLDLRSQVPVDANGQTFRLDFVVGLQPMLMGRVVSAGLSWPLIGVELDGHAFHEKTVEQVTYRNRRDRLLQQAGWTVFHVSFNEIQTRGMDAVSEVFVYALNRVQQLPGELL